MTMARVRRVKGDDLKKSIATKTDELNALFSSVKLNDHQRRVVENINQAISYFNKSIEVM